MSKGFATMGTMSTAAPSSSSPPASPDTAHRQTRYAPPAGATEFVLVRHGATQPYYPGKPFALLDGHGDPELAPEGVAQAEAVARRLLAERVDALVITNLRRTAQTIAPYVAVSGLQPQVMPELREVYLGEWEGGRLREHAAKGHPAWHKVVADHEWGHIPGAETSGALRMRCVAALNALHQRHPGQRVVCVLHGGVIGALCAYAVGAKARAFDGSDNGSMHTLVLLGPDWQLRRFNDTTHLDAAPVNASS
jgi:probable phosphoglycerate mutase